MLQVGRGRLMDRGYAGNIEYVQADAEHLPFPDNTFNAVSIAFGLRNVTDKDQALRDMARVLKPGGKLMVLESGLKFQALQMNPEDVQLLETRRFNVEDVCRWFGTPPIIVGHASEGQTMWGSGIEAVMLSWLALGINPRLIRIADRVKVDLVPVERRRRWSLKFDRDNMLQMDSKSKGDFMSKMSTSGTMTANERREVVGLARHNDPAADKLMIQGAMVSIDDLLKGNSDG